MGAIVVDLGRKLGEEIGYSMTSKIGVHLQVYNSTPTLSRVPFEFEITVLLINQETFRVRSYYNTPKTRRFHGNLN